MRHRIAIILLVTGLAVTCLSQRMEPRSALPSQISESALRAHIKFLSDDRLESRGTGAKGGEVAALYVAEQFEAMGLKGAGAKGRFWQPVSLDAGMISPARVSVSSSTGAIALPELLKRVGKKPAESKMLLRSMKKASPCSLFVPERML